MSCSISRLSGIKAGPFLTLPSTVKKVARLLLTRIDPNRITPLNGRAIHCHAFQNTLGVTTFKSSILGVEMADQVVFQTIVVDILWFTVTESQTLFIPRASKGEGVLIHHDQEH